MIVTTLFSLLELARLFDADRSGVLEVEKSVMIHLLPPKKKIPPGSVPFQNAQAVLYKYSHNFGSSFAQTEG